jgi:NADH:ubiquinone oxidoreductase subunit 6 (subunit J)
MTILYTIAVVIFVGALLVLSIYGLGMFVRELFKIRATEKSRRRDLILTMIIGTAVALLIVLVYQLTGRR